jgi:beta-phosphoglucomutase
MVIFMKHIEACIFDLDGVIVDTAKYHYLAWKRLSNELGFDLTPEDNERLKGVSRMASLDIVLSIGLKAFDHKTKYTLAAKKNSWYVEYLNEMDENEILPGVKNFLLLLKDKGIKIALGSASKNSPLILGKLHLTHYFDVIIDGNKTTKAKPDPEVFLLAASELNVFPEHCVVFEDAQAGIDAARRAGMYCIGIGSADVLKGSDKVIPGFANYDELTRLLRLFQPDYPVLPPL